MAVVFCLAPKVDTTGQHLPSNVGVRALAFIAMQDVLPGLHYLFIQNTLNVICPLHSLSCSITTSYIYVAVGMGAVVTMNTGEDGLKFSLQHLSPCFDSW